VAADPLRRLLGDVVRGISELVEVRAPGLRRDVAGVALTVFAPEAIRQFGMLRLQPAQPVAEALVGVVVAQGHVLEAVERQREPVFGVQPARSQFLFVGSRGRRLPAGLRVTLRRLRPGKSLRGRQHRRQVLHVLQMALADQRRAVAGLGQQVGESDRLERQGNAVAASAMGRRHAPGHDRAAVGHAHRCCDVGALEALPGAGQRVDVRRLHDRVAVAAEVVGSVLVGDEDQEVRTHGAVPVGSRHGVDCSTRNWAQQGLDVLKHKGRLCPVMSL
jgi:hypothetical protein